MDSTIGNETMNWQELAATSHYRTAVSIAEELAAGNVRGASEGLEELIEAVARSERRALRSQLIRLMTHIIKWKDRPDRRSVSWEVTILQARDEIASIQDEVPSLTRSVIEKLWEASLRAASRQARAEMRKAPSTTSLSWHEVFEVEYSLADDCNPN